MNHENSSPHDGARPPDETSWDLESAEQPSPSEPTLDDDRTDAFFPADDDWGATLSVENMPSLWDDPNTDESESWLPAWIEEEERDPADSVRPEPENETLVAPSAPEVEDTPRTTTFAPLEHDPWHGKEPPAGPTQSWEQQEWRLIEEPPPAERDKPARRLGTAVRWGGLILTILTIFLLLGIWQGLNARQVNARDTAIDHFERGVQLLEEENYELARANFAEALRLQPEFAAASQLLTLTEARLAESRVTPTVPPTTTPSTDELAERQFATGVEALSDDAWEQAISIFQMLRRDEPQYRRAEVEEALFTALREAALQALDDNPEEALELLDQALALRDDETALEELQAQLTAYVEGKEALDDKRWDKAEATLRALYLADPGFLDTSVLLARATVGQAQRFEEEDEWCDAADSYRIALRYQQSASTQSRLETALEACNTGVAPVASARGTPTVSISQSPEITATATFSDTLPAVQPTRPGVAATATQPRATVVPTLPVPTATIVPVPTAPPSNSGPFYVLEGGVTVLDSCGAYIQGIIRAADGTPQPGVTIQAIDPFGNVLTAVSKQNPLGVYDIPISSDSPRYDIQLFVNGQAASSGAFVTQVVGQAACFQLNWRGQ